MTLILLLKHALCRMITNQTRPPRVSLEFRPQNIIEFNPRRAFFALDWFICRSFLYSRFLFVDWGKTLRFFFRRMVLLFLGCLAAYWRRRLLRLRCFSEVGEESRHVYLFDRSTDSREFSRVSSQGTAHVQDVQFKQNSYPDPALRESYAYVFLTRHRIGVGKCHFHVFLWTPPKNGGHTSPGLKDQQSKD